MKVNCYLCKESLEPDRDANGRIQVKMGIKYRSRKFCRSCGVPVLLRVEKILGYSIF